MMDSYQEKEIVSDERISIYTFTFVTLTWQWILPSCFVAGHIWAPGQYESLLLQCVH